MLYYLSRETFWYDRGQKPYKASYVLRACDEYDHTENWYFRRQGTRCPIPLDSVAQLNYRKFGVLNYMQQFGKLEANVLTKLDRNAPSWYRRSYEQAR